MKCILNETFLNFPNAREGHGHGQSSFEESEYPGNCWT